MVFVWELAPGSNIGFQLKGEVKEMKMITMSGKEYLFILQNDEMPLLYRRNLK